MRTLIVESPRPVTLVGGGEIAAGDLELAEQLAPTLVAADGGADSLVETGRLPAAVIGDFDSLSDAVRAALPPDRLHHIAEQESTDFDKALRSIAAPVVIAVGFLGARVDHQLAALNTLVQPGRVPCVLLGAQEVICHVPPELRLPTRPGEVVSLFPLVPVRGQSTGLDWPIDGLEMTPGGRIGTSNRASGALQLTAEGPGLLAILPRRLLPDLVAQLPGAAGW